VRYRRDVPRDDTDINSVVEHVRIHLAGAVSHNDDPSDRLSDVTVEVLDHLDGDVSQLSVIGEIDGEPDAPYLYPDFDPSADHPEIAFVPFEQPHLGRFADHSEGGRHERWLR
jgi:hypothetical protein